MTSNVSETPAPASLAGTSAEVRADLLRFGSAREGCRVMLGKLWSGPLCGQYAPWYIGCENSQAGMTENGFFHPATTYTHVCDEHLAQLRGEPRTIFSVKAGSPEDFGSVSLIDVSAIDRFLGGDGS